MSILKWLSVLKRSVEKCFGGNCPGWFFFLGGNCPGQSCPGGTVLVGELSGGGNCPRRIVRGEI